MEKNYINCKEDTCLYIDLDNKTYGVRVSEKDSNKSKEVILEVLKSNQDTINAWKRYWKEGVI